LISYLYHPSAIASATALSPPVFAAAEIAAYIAVFAVPINVSTFEVVIFADVMFTDAIVPVVVEIFAVVMFAVVILAIFAVSTDVTFALLNVELPVTDNVFAIVAEPFTLKSSNPIASSVILPDTVKSPEIMALPAIVELP
jgi:hypothetical protein